MEFAEAKVRLLRAGRQGGSMLRLLLDTYCGHVYQVGFCLGCWVHIWAMFAKLGPCWAHLRRMRKPRPEDFRWRIGHTSPVGIDARCAL